MKRIFLFYIVSVLVVLLGCGEDEKIKALQEEQRQLLSQKDSLLKRQSELEKSSDLLLVSDTVKAGNGLFQVLERMGLSEEERRLIVLSIQDSVELSKMRVGQKFHALLDGNKKVKVFRYEENPATIHLLFKTDSGFVYNRPEKTIVRKHSIFEGSLAEGSTLDGTLRSVGIPKHMVGVVSGVLQCKVAFQLAQPGDKFRILLEENFFEDSIWISGKVLYAEFDGKTVGHHEAFRYEDPDPKSSFNAHYTETGEALVFDGLRYPLDRLHVTSAYGSRIHPITGQRKVHHGIDYGSPTGTPVYAVAEGVVTLSGYDNLSGNKISIRHRDGSSSWYLHLHTRAVSQGAHVNARQVIGRVGNTGRSTGPHLHFGFKDEKGRWINPSKKTMIATPKLEGERLARLKSQAKAIRESLTETAAVAPQKAGDSEVLVRIRKLQ
jgi:murein DD-endopeptidase MepM/ murein hydrolase activator NlpD